MRILIVEDERKIAAGIGLSLENAGYIVEFARDGEQAWFLAETENFDGIVLDLGLPRLDGLSVIKKLRAAGVMTPILILTARGSWMERVEGIDVGADDYLAKPFHSEELMARLGAILRRSGGHVTPVMEAGGLRLDTRKLQVMLDDRPISMTQLEFRALRYLMHNKGRVVSQGELAEHVYASEQEPDSNALEVLVGRMRKKLGTGTITTRRGHGYVIEN
ncbi:MAG: response regulator transcription factor [Beijerinckiaceae bacterium]